MKTTKTTGFEIERSKWGWSVVFNNREIELFDKKAEAMKFIEDFNRGDYHGTSYEAEVVKATGK